jgi:mono/diheme cytochrome c family protein
MGTCVGAMRILPRGRSYYSTWNARGWIGAQILLATAVLVSCGQEKVALSPYPLDNASPQLIHGLEVYQEQCAPCHGVGGQGDGPAAYLLYPRPRDFSGGTFRLTSTESGMPNDSDLARSIRMGLPGSAMPPWDYLPESDIDNLVAAVRYLAVEGKTQTLLAENEISREAAYSTAAGVMTQGDPVSVPDKPPSGAIDLEHGRQLYVKSCAPCHDADGRGQLRRDMVDAGGFPIFARDFTKGIFKGGSDPELLALRIVRGLPGSPMPALPFGGADLWSIVGYIETLIEPGAQMRIQQTHTTIEAKRVEGAAPKDPDDHAWMQAQSYFLPLMPLWWRTDRIEGVTVSAMHDGQQIAIRLSWRDESADVHQLDQTAFSDGVAMQFSNRENPPPLSMGAPDGNVNIWYWRAALDPEAAKGNVALVDLYPHMSMDATDAYPGTPKEPEFMTAAAVGNPVATSDSNTPVQLLHAAGFGTLTAAASSKRPVSGLARRSTDGWHVVITRSIAGDSDGSVIFTGTHSVAISFAVWDGQAGDRNGQKSISIWHKLHLGS